MPISVGKEVRKTTVVKHVFKSGKFAGVDAHDTFALAALKETPVAASPVHVAWPNDSGNNSLAPKPTAGFGNYKPGVAITGALSQSADALIILYTDEETEALLNVFTGDPSWTPARKKTWYPYAHNFPKFKNSIEGIGGDKALSAGYFGYLYPMTIGTKNVVLYKTELHPKDNGLALPFIPVIAQLVSELAPKMVLSTGTAGAIGPHINCGDVVITDTARLHCKDNYPLFPDLTTMSRANTELKNSAPFNGTYVNYAAANFTKLSLPGLAQCYGKIGNKPGYSFLKKNTSAPSIYLKGVNNVPGGRPMDIVSADYLTVDDNNDSEGLEPLGSMNDTDDAFVFYAIQTLPAAKQPKWLSVRNASEPQVVVPPFPAGASPTQIVDKLKSVAGAIYGVYQICTTVNSAFACWGVVAGL